MTTVKRLSIKNLHKQIKKPFRLLYSKSPILAISVFLFTGIIVLGGSTYGIYRLATVTETSNQTSEVKEIGGLDQSTTPEITDLQDKSKPDTKKTDKSDTAVDDTNPDQTATDPKPADESSSDEEYESSLVSSVYSINLGGPEPVGPGGVSIRSSSGKKIAPLRVSKTPSKSAATHSIDFGGVRVYESPTTDGTNYYETVRDLVVTQSDVTTSGKATFYVFAGYDDEKPVAITVTWKPTPQYYNEKTGQSLTVNGNKETYTMNFKIVPNAYFGKPKLTFSLGQSNYCGAGSVTTINTTYNGTKNFSLTCVHTVTTECDSVCPLRSDPVFNVSVTAQTSGGYYIPGSSSMRYAFEL